MTEPKALYIHIPYCVSKCSYCDFFSVGCGTTSVPDRYIDSLCSEIKFRIKKYGVSEFNTIYIGGGTPSLLSQNQLKKIIDVIKTSAGINQNYEFTIEVNPDDITVELLKTFEICGITRISCGIQSLNDKALNFANRRASVNQNRKALNLFKEFWKGELSIDLICGLPEETELSFLQGLQEIIDYNPDHISMYSLTIEDETPFGGFIQKGELSLNLEFQDNLWLSGRDLLLKNGYKHYEVSNFCRENKECKHNLVYWNHVSYIGAGSGACGTVYDNNGLGYRWINKPELEGYINFWNSDVDEKNLFEEQELIQSETSEFEFYMMGFRKLSGITEKEFYSVFKKQIPDDVKSILEKWKKKSLLEIEKENDTFRYKLNKNGILLLNRLLEELV